MKKIITLSMMIFALMSFTSCATIFTGSKDTLSFNSNTSGAAVYKDGIKLCTTPCNVRMKRSLSEVDVELKLEGYQTHLITLDRKFNAVSIINLGSLLGWGIDALTGSIMKYDRKGYEVDLDPVKTAALLSPKKIMIDTKTKVVDVYVVK